MRYNTTATRLEDFPGAEHKACQEEAVAGRESASCQEATGEVKVTPIPWLVNSAFTISKKPIFKVHCVFLSLPRSYFNKTQVWVSYTWFQSSLYKTDTNPVSTVRSRY